MDDGNLSTHAAGVDTSQQKQRIPLRHAGICNLPYPFVVWDRDRRNQHTVGEFRLTVELPSDVRVPYMRHFLEAMEVHTQELSQETVPEFVDDLRSRLNVERAAVLIDFPYFLRRRAPVSGSTANVKVHASIDCTALSERQTDVTLTVRVPLMTVCPSSKEYSRYGAHTQRATVSISVRYREMVWIEDLAEIADKASSSSVYTLISREDEKWLTESAYENPAYIEDVVRNVAEHLLRDPRITWFSLEGTSDASAHVHSTYAAVSSDDLDAAR